MRKPMTTKMASLSLLLVSATLWACGSAPMVVAPQAMQPAPAVRSLTTQTAGEKAFREELGRRNIRLSEDQIAIIRAERRAVPSGLFAPRPAANLTAEQNLEVHYQKHRKEFGHTSAEEYLREAIAHLAGRKGELQYFYDTTSFQKGYQTHVVRWNPQSKDFGAVKADGAITTYYKNFTINSKRFVPVPAM